MLTHTHNEMYRKRVNEIIVFVILLFAILLSFISLFVCVYFFFLSLFFYIIFFVVVAILFSDSTCITPISNASCSSTASHQSSPSITPINSSTFTETAYLTACSSLSFDTFSESTSADAYSIPTDTNDLNATVTNQSGSTFYESCIRTPKNLRRITKSVPQRLRRRILDYCPRLQRLSIASVFQINISGDQTTLIEPEAVVDCACEDGLFDGKCLKSFMEMSVQPAEYRNNSQIMTSTPVITKDVYDPSLFNVARFKKVELHELSPKMSEFHGKF